jgi:hypothetical protein
MGTYKPSTLNPQPSTLKPKPPWQQLSHPEFGHNQSGTSRNRTGGSAAVTKQQQPSASLGSLGGSRGSISGTKPSRWVSECVWDAKGGGDEGVAGEGCQRRATVMLSMYGDGSLSLQAVSILPPHPPHHNESGDDKTKQLPWHSDYLKRASILNPPPPHRVLTEQTVLRHSDGEATCQQTASLCGRFTAEDATVAEQTASLCGRDFTAGAEARNIRMVIEGDHSPETGLESPAFPVYFGSAFPPAFPAIIWRL